MKDFFVIIAVVILVSLFLETNTINILFLLCLWWTFTDVII